MRIFRLSPIILAAVLGGCGDDATQAPPENREIVDAGKSALPATGPAQTPTTPPAQDRRSVFTSLDLKQCRLIEENIDEGGYSRHDCPGHAGYRIELIESDLRQNIALIRPNGTKDELDLAARIGGGGFSEIGKTIEWRGADRAKPRTLTLRFNVNESPEPAVPPRSYLIVIRLAAPACPVAKIAPGPTQSNDARRIADATTLPACGSGPPDAQ